MGRGPSRPKACERAEEASEQEGPLAENTALPPLCSPQGTGVTQDLTKGLSEFLSVSGGAPRPLAPSGPQPNDARLGQAGSAWPSALEETTKVAL